MDGLMTRWGWTQSGPNQPRVGATNVKRRWLWQFSLIEFHRWNQKYFFTPWQEGVCRRNNDTSTTPVLQLISTALHTTTSKFRYPKLSNKLSRKLKTLPNFLCMMQVHFTEQLAFLIHCHITWLRDLWYWVAIIALFNCLMSVSIGYLSICDVSREMVEIYIDESTKCSCCTDDCHVMPTIYRACLGIRSVRKRVM